MHWQRYVVGEIASVSAIARAFAPDRVLRDKAGNALQTVHADVDDTYFATLEFQRGAIGQLWWSWAMSQDGVGVEGGAAVLGERGVLRNEQIWTDTGEKLPLVETFQREMTDAEREQFFPLGLDDAYAIQNLDWLRAIENHRDPETSGEEGLRDLACAFAILESSALGRRVTQDEMLAGDADAYQREIDEHYELR